MADEISLNMRADIRNGKFFDQFLFSSGLFDQVAQGGFKNVINIGTSDESLTIPEVASFGLAVFQNLDEDNYVEIGPDSGGSIVPFLRLRPGQPGLMWLSPSITIRAQADTAPVELLAMVMEA